MSQWYSHICETRWHCFDFKEDLLLFSEQTQQLLLLNQTSKAVWEGIQAGLNKTDIIKILTKTTGIEQNRIQSDVESIVSQWENLGLFDTRPPEKPPPETSKKKNPAPVIFDSDKMNTCCFKIIDTVFEFNTPDKTCNKMLIEHVSHLISETRTPDVRLYLIQTDRQFFLYKNNMIIDRCADENGIIPMVHAAILMTAYDRSDCLMGLHASAVIYNRACLLMPAASGQGKSTLTAALIQSGFNYGADDLVLLSKSLPQIIPVPSAIGLKPDSWPVVEKWHPEIRNCREHVRADKKIIRYLPMRNKKIQPDALTSPVEASHIIYPSYLADSPCCLEQLSPAQSMINLSKAGFDMHQVFDKKLVQQLVDWVKLTPSYTLTYSNIDEAIACLKSIAD